jgi:hypothetical protein
MTTWRWLRPGDLDQSQTSLTFTDVIFGLVFTQIFVRASSLGGLPPAVNVHLALSLVVAAGSYIGYRGSLKRGTYKLAFFNLPLLRFTLDLFMIFLYYVLAVTPHVTKNKPILVHARMDSLVIFLIFAAYLVWDLVSKVMSDHNYTQITYKGIRTAVTLAGLVAAGVIVVVAWMAGSPLNQHLAIGVDVALLVVMILYRYVKDGIVS